jgi:hypothetical protein
MILLEPPHILLVTFSAVCLALDVSVVLLLCVEPDIMLTHPRVCHRCDHAAAGGSPQEQGLCQPEEHKPLRPGKGQSVHCMISRVQMLPNMLLNLCACSTILFGMRTGIIGALITLLDFVATTCLHKFVGAWAPGYLLRQVSSMPRRPKAPIGWLVQRVKCVLLCCCMCCP